MDMHPPPIIEERINSGFCAVSEPLKRARASWLRDCREGVNCEKSTGSMLKHPVEKILCSLGAPVEEEVEMQRMHVTPDFRVELQSASIRFLDEYNIKDALKSSNAAPVLFYLQNKASRKLALLAGLIARSGFDVFAYPVIQNSHRETAQIARVCAAYNTGFVPALIFYDRTLKKLHTDLHIKGSIAESKYFSDNKPIAEQYRRYISRVKRILK